MPVQGNGQGPSSTVAAATDSKGTPLFRAEVVAARQDQWLGGIRINTPRGYRVATGAALAMAVALTAFACWGEVTRKVSVSGLLLPKGGLINVASEQAGVIAEVFVREGDEVTVGQPILRLRSERVTAAGNAALLTAQAMAARRATLETERRLTVQNLRLGLDSLQQRRQSLQAEKDHASAELDTHRLRLQLANESLERQQRLARDGFVALAQVQQKQEELLDLQLRERSAERNVQALHRELEVSRADRQALEIQTQTALAQLARNVALLDQEATEADGRYGLTITAP